jgi:hypothetical protein
VRSLGANRFVSQLATVRSEMPSPFKSYLPSLDFNIWYWQAKIEYKFDASPIAVFAAYQGTRSHLDTGIDTEQVTDNRILAGLRIYFGDRTLRGNDTMGATLDIKDPISLLSPSLN